MIRKIKQADVSALKEILNRVPNFSDEEVNVAMELIEIAAFNQAQNDYNIFIL